MFAQWTTVLALSPQERVRYLQQHPSFLAEMFGAIGHPNGQLRDGLNYRLFMELVSANQIPHETLRQWASDLPTQLLQFEQQDDVFTRSFSALWLTALVYADRQLQLLTAQQYTAIVESATQLLMKEQDLRSFINAEAGWAHSVAHTTDLLVACIQHPFFELRFAPPILQALKQVLWKSYVFADDEEERFVRVMEALIAAGVDEILLLEWLEQLFDRLEQLAYMEGYTADWFKGRTNTLHFAKTLYFTLKFSQRYDKLRGTTSIFIQKWLKLN